MGLGDAERVLVLVSRYILYRVYRLRGKLDILDYLQSVVDSDTGKWFRILYNIVEEEKIWLENMLSNLINKELEKKD